MTLDEAAGRPRKRQSPGESPKASSFEQGIEQMFTVQSARIPARGSDRRWRRRSSGRTKQAATTRRNRRDVVQGHRRTRASNDRRRRCRFVSPAHASSIEAEDERARRRGAKEPQSDDGTKHRAHRRTMSCGVIERRSEKGTATPRSVSRPRTNCVWATAPSTVVTTTARTKATTTHKIRISILTISFARFLAV